METTPSKARVLDHLGEILSSAEFAASPRASELLEHIVVKTLDGQTDQLTGYAIGLDVFGRDSSFDPMQDSIVRVQMTRLRKMLSHYYATAAAEPALRIDIPKGQYEASFLAGPEPTDDPCDDNPALGLSGGKASSSATGGGSWLRRITPVKLIAGLLAVLALSIGGLQLYRQMQETSAQSLKIPTVYVAQFEGLDSRPATELVEKGIRRDIISHLSQFPNFKVLGIDTVIGQNAQLAGARAFDADFVLDGSVATTGEKLSIVSSLISVADGHVIWTDRAERDLDDTADIVALQHEIALGAASALGQPYGVIQNAGRRLSVSTPGASLKEYRCVLSAYDYMKSKTAEKHFAVRECLEAAVAAYPDYAKAWSLLSFIYGDELRQQFNLRSSPPAGRRALVAAQRGLEADAHNATAYEYLSIALFLNERDVDAVLAAEKAISLSPNNSEILADLGWNLALLGETERAEELLSRAIELNPGHPAWYWGGLAVVALTEGRADDAIRYSQLYREDGVFSIYIQAASQRLNGDADAADAVLRAAAKQFPGVDKPDNPLVRHNRIPPEISRLIFGA